MNPASVEWLPAVVTLAIGLVTGAFVYFRARSGAARAPARKAAAAHAEDLVAKRDALVLQLQEMEDTGSKRTPEQLARERYELELEAAHVLLALDVAAEAERLAPRNRSPKTAPPQPRGAFAGVRTFLWGIGTATTLLLLGFFVYQQAKPREAGGSVTGEVPGRGSDPATAEEARVEAALARNPSDVDAHLALAQLKLERRDLMAVWNETRRVLELAPGNPMGLAYEGFVRIAMGQPDVAAEVLRKSIAADPAFIDAHAWLALAYARMGRRQDAQATVAAASQRFPDRAEEFRRFLAAVDRDSAAETAASDEADPHAGVAAGSPAAASSRESRGSAKGSQKHVAGTIDLDPSLAGKVPPRAVLFVFVRPAGVAAGPPSAVKRLAPVFPVAFDLSEDDAMMGQPFPDSVLVEARLDEDGDPTTRPPTDPKARVDGVRAGRTDVRLLLKRQ